MIITYNKLEHSKLKSNISRKEWETIDIKTEKGSAVDVTVMEQYQYTDMQVN